MDKDTFIEMLRNAHLEGLVFENIHKGSISIISTSKDRIHYHRGKDTLSLKYSHLYKAWKNFRGDTVTSKALKRWKPATFDSRAHPRAGHDCNCGLFVLLMEHLGLASDVNRDGRHYSATLLTAG